MSTLGERIIVCHRCEKHGKLSPPLWPCTIDGRDITDHAAAGDCPAGKFTGERIDPAALASIQRQQAGCAGCGDAPLDGI